MKRGRLTLAVVFAAWLPLIVLTIIQASSIGAGLRVVLEQQVGVHVRSLVSIPLLLLAERTCVPRLWRIIDQFLAADLITDRTAFDASLTAARRGMAPGRLRGALVFFAFVVSAALAVSIPVSSLPEWHRSNGWTPHFSPAGWWHVLVCLPLLFALAFRWLWRISVWELLLWRIAHSGLRLVASHPDGAAGLGFVGGSARAFASVGLAFSAVAAGHAAQFLAAGGRLATAQLWFNGGFLLFLVLLFVAPVCVFTPALILVSRRGAMVYGALAQHVGSTFEHRWIDDETRVIDDDSLSVQDFSATTDLYSIVANARGVRVVPVSRRDLLTFAIGLTVPFLPVLLTAVPAGTIWEQARGFLF